MGGLPWFELDVEFSENPKIRTLASRLREPLADAYVARIYAYCYSHAVERFDPSAAPEIIEDAARWRGRRGFLFDALMAVGVLEREAGKVVVHGVAERLGPHLAKREADAERQRNRRAKAATSIGRPKIVTPDVPRDVPVTSRVSHGGTRTETETTTSLARTLPINGERGREEQTRLGPLGQKLVSAVEAGLGHGLTPPRNGQAEALERAVEARGYDESLAFIASTCRQRDVEPQSVAWLVKVLGGSA
jgi:hypothetical protein